MHGRLLKMRFRLGHAVRSVPMLDGDICRKGKKVKFRNYKSILQLKKFGTFSTRLWAEADIKCLEHVTLPYCSFNSLVINTTRLEHTYAKKKWPASMKRIELLIQINLYSSSEN